MKMTLLGPLLVGLLGCVLSSCSTPTTTKLDPHQTFTVKLQLSQSAVNAGGVVHVWMGPVPANIYGSPTARRLIDIRVAPGAEFPLSAVALESDLAAAATTSTLSPFRFEPTDTKVARVGTFAMDTDGRYYRVGFEDSALEHAFVLIYVDRPCLVKGPANDFALGRPGLHWLRTDLPVTGANPVLERVDAPQTIVLFAESAR